MALFYGDGMFTPAITVLSAVEYAGAETGSITPLIVPIALAILIALFAFQSRGTARIGGLFGPVMAIWFVVLAVIGLHAILRTPQILWALDPGYALKFFVAMPVSWWKTCRSCLRAETSK